MSAFFPVKVPPMVDPLGDPDLGQAVDFESFAGKVELGSGPCRTNPHL